MTTGEVLEAASEPERAPDRDGRRFGMRATRRRWTERDRQKRRADAAHHGRSRELGLRMAQQRFSGVLEAGRGGGHWVVVPFDVRAEFGEARPPAKGT